MAEETKTEEPKKEEPKVEEPKKEPARSASQDDAGGEPKAEVPSKYKKLVEEIEKMPLAEVAELVKALEDRWGVAAMAVGTPAAAAPSGTAPGAVPDDEKSVYTVVLADGGAQKIAVIKAVREIRQDLGLKEAKDLVDGAPKEVLKDAKKDDAQAAKTKLEATGAKVELK